MPSQFRFIHRLGFKGLTAERLSHWAVPAATWGVGAGVAVTLFASSIPLFQADVLHKIPVVRTYFIDTTPDSDKPF
ncbi:hypothetical protein IAT38_006748 [Cryptococcus sp. DSM 104549]